MDKLEMGGRRGASSQAALGRGLATIHSAPTPLSWPRGRFGFPLDGCCGALFQPNNPPPAITADGIEVGGDDGSGLSTQRWAEFWSDHRLGFQLSQRGCQRCKELQELGAKLIPKLPALFAPLEADGGEMLAFGLSSTFEKKKLSLLAVSHEPEPDPFWVLITQVLLQAFCTATFGQGTTL